MSGTAVAGVAAGLPAHLQGTVGKEEFDEFAGGVTSGFAVISYRGRTWRVKKGGEEQVYLNEEQEAVQSIAVVLVKSNKLPSKVFYESQYNEGDSGPPSCWSANGLKPDDGVESPVHPTCQACPNNAWGSKISENGNKTRACSDVRRCAVVFEHQLEEHVAGERDITDVDVMLLRIPPATLNPLKDYVEKTLKPKSIAPFMLITKVGFDTEVAYPKLTFRGLRFLSADEFAAISQLRDGEEARRILNESLENVTDDGEGTTGNGGEVPAGTAQTAAEAPTPAPSPSPKMEAVEEEELTFSELVDDIAPAPPRAADVETAAEAVEEIAIAPAAAKKKTTKKASKKVAKKAPVPATEAAAPAADTEDYDAMLDSILGAE